MIPDDDIARYESEEENIDSRQKERPVGPPMILEVPLRPPPARPEKVEFPSFLRSRPLVSDVLISFCHRRHFYVPGD